MEPKLWISQIEFSDNKRISFSKNDIVLFVGPNNAGKSATLKESLNLLFSKSAKTKVIKSISFSTSGNSSDVRTFVEGISKIRRSATSGNIHFDGFGFSIYSDAINNWWSNLGDGIGELSKVFAKYLTTEERLIAANPATNIKLTSEPAQHPINFLQKSDSLEKKFSDYFRQAFGLDLIVHRNAGKEVPLYVGNTPPIAFGQDRLSEAYQIELEKLDLLHEQGDGMRSFVGVLLNAFISYRSLLFIDEPEAFLHPPQARLLGKMLAKDLPTDRQLLMATHSSDFLKGLLEANTSNLKIVRIERQDAINTVSVLNNTEINAIWNDSLLRHSNILDGLFHSHVLICESDSDCRFYSAIQDAIYEKTNELSPDTLHIHCSGKHRLPIVIKALKQLDVKIKVIADFDILNDISPLKDVFEESGGNWTDIEKDWKTVKMAIESKRPELESKELKNEIDEIFSTVTEKIIPKEKITLIQKSLRKASAWIHAKEVGKFFIPNGDPTQAYERLISNLKAKKIFVVEVGELESFCKSVGSHGPKWVNDVLTKDLANDPELNLARQFIKEVIA